MLRVVMVASLAIGIFLIASRQLAITGMPVLDDGQLIGIELGLGLIFAFSGSVVVTPSDSALGYVGRPRRVIAALFMVVSLAIIVALAVWFLHYYGPPDVKKLLTF